MNNEERLKISNQKLNALENILPDYIVKNVTQKKMFKILMTFLCCSNV